MFAAYDCGETRHRSKANLGLDVKSDFGIYSIIRSVVSDENMLLRGKKKREILNYCLFSLKN